MFIHRDDLDPEKKRDAELIIAKHRNGPTGNVRLHLEPSLTMFRNAAREVPVPRALWGRAFGVELRATYRGGKASG